MHTDATQIERIVREVLRRLPAPESATVAAAPAEPLAVERLATELAATLIVDERVVTMDRLTGRLAGVTRVEVSPRAIVTPLVADLLRQKGISLLRCRAGSENTPAPLPPSTSGGPVVIVTCDSASAQRVSRALEGPCADLPVNVLVVDPARLNDEQLRRIVRRCLERPASGPPTQRGGIR